MTKQLIIIVTVISIFITVGCTPKFYELSADITGRSWSVAIAKREYYSGTITKGEYRSIVYHIKREYKHIVTSLKNDYRTGVISRDDYRERVREAKYAYNVEGMHSIKKNQSPSLEEKAQLAPDIGSELNTAPSGAEIAESEQNLYGALPIEPKEMIKQKCNNDFLNDYSRQAECAERQAKSWFELNQ